MSMGGAHLSKPISEGLSDWRRAAAAASDAGALGGMIDAAARHGEDRIGAWQVLDGAATLAQAETLVARQKWRDLAPAGVRRARLTKPRATATEPAARS